MNLTQKNTEHFNIISFSADEKIYYPSTIMQKQSWMDDTYVPHSEMQFGLGHSRFGGPILDLTPNFKTPENLCFAAQLDLAKFSPFDVHNLLPKQGQLIFFSDLLEDRGQVFYFDTSNTALERIYIEHEDHFFEGVLIKDIFSDQETFAERINLDADEDEQWDYFAGSERSKIFGIFTHCQKQKEEIEAITHSEQVVLLQVGENGFNDEGVFSILISKSDLLNRNFNHCTFYWGQS